MDYVRMIEGATPGCRHHAGTMPAAPSKMALVQAAEALERIRAGGVAARAAGVGCAPSLTRLKCTTARVVAGELTRVSASLTGLLSAEQGEGGGQLRGWARGQ